MGFPVNIAKVLRGRVWKNIRERLLLKIRTSVTNLLEGSISLNFIILLNLL